MSDVFPLLPAAFGDAPPPGIQVLVEEERARMFGLADDEATLDDSINPPSVTALEPQAAARDVDLAEIDPATSDLPLLTVSNRSVNIRSGPGLSFSVVAGAPQGTIFEALGRSEDNGWWRICCVRGPEDGADEATLQAWISNVVVSPNDAAADLPILGAVFPNDLQSEWAVSYACGSERCEVVRCDGAILADVRSGDDPKWLEIERKITWNDACGENSTWLHQIDRIEGTERYENTADLFLFNFWAGINPGQINSLFTLNDVSQVKTWCSDEQEVDLDEGNGWSARYNGVTCHDVRTGMLVSMKYTKRWLFTGTFDGDTYEDAYFGDYEIYEVRLVDTNVELDFVK
ncbi:MAG: SH3 domain-containing protein [Caldilineaceae bacterium]